MHLPTIEIILLLLLLLMAFLINIGRRNRVIRENFRFLNQKEATAQIVDFLTSTEPGGVIVATSRSNRRFVQFTIETCKFGYVPVWDIPIAFASKDKIDQLKQFLDGKNLPIKEKLSSDVPVIHSELGTDKDKINLHTYDAISYAQVQEPIDLWVGNIHCH